MPQIINLPPPATSKQIIIAPPGSTNTTVKRARAQPSIPGTKEVEVENLRRQLEDSFRRIEELKNENERIKELENENEEVKAERDALKTENAKLRSKLERVRDLILEADFQRF